MLAGTEKSSHLRLAIDSFRAGTKQNGTETHTLVPEVCFVSSFCSDRRWENEKTVREGGLLNRGLVSAVLAVAHVAPPVGYF